MVNRKQLNNLFWTCLCVGMLLWPGAAAAQPTAPCAADVIVRTGDSLSAIATRRLGTAAAYPRIVEATNAQSAIDASYATIADPAVIEVGWKLCIPLDATNRTVATDAAALNTDANTLLAGLAGAFEPAQIRALSIPTMRARTYLGSPLIVEQTLAPAANYKRYLVSYRSDGLQIFGLLTVPTGTPPPTGWPVILFNHGYIPPDRYRPTERYEAHIDALARNGYIILRPDFRGHGASEGSAAGGYTGPAYTIDVLNAVAAVRTYAPADPARIGMWGHSLGGLLTLRSMVIDKNINAGVIWSGVVVAVPDLLALLDFSPTPIPSAVFRFRDQLYRAFGTPQANPDFWNTISPNHFLTDLSGPLQLHHGTGDAIVPVLFSAILTDQVAAAGQAAELFTYPGDDHNITANFDTAMARTLRFFDEQVKGPRALP